MAENWLLYGANGYTGVLIAEEAVRRGLRPVLAGRREEAVRPLAERLGLEYRVFELDTAERIATQLQGFGAILLAAGPFSATSRPVVDACLATGVHYLDITGEIAVFEACHRRDAEARRRGVVLLPGVGFDVVPSDCLAASLAQALPGATTLELAFSPGGSKPSKGTATTMVEGIGQGGAIRKGGKIQRVPLAWRTAEIPFRDGPRHAVTIPWGDVSTAYYSTKIPDIMVFVAMPRRMTRMLRLARPFARLLALAPAQRLLKRRIARTVTGPDAETRRTVRSHLYGRVSDASGRSVTATLETPEGYVLTALTAVESVVRVLGGGVAPGAHTPSMAFSPTYISKFQGCELRVDQRS